MPVRSAWHLQEHMQNRHYLVPVRRPTVRNEIWQLDLRRRSGKRAIAVVVASILHRQESTVDSERLACIGQWGCDCILIIQAMQRGSGGTMDEVAEEDVCDGTRR